MEKAHRYIFENGYCYRKAEAREKRIAELGQANAIKKDGSWCLPIRKIRGDNDI